MASVWFIMETQGWFREWQGFKNRPIEFSAQILAEANGRKCFFCLRSALPSMFGAFAVYPFFDGLWESLEKDTFLLFLFEL